MKRIAMGIGLLLGCLQAPSNAFDGSPNVVLIMADDLGYGDLSCYGGDIPTPQLDRLAEEGLRLTDFHSSGNVCSPTRAGLLTGRYQRRAGIPGVVYANPRQASHFTGLGHPEVTFAELFRQAGYATGLFGKWHLGYSRFYNPVQHGFQEFRGYVSGNVDYISHRDGMDRFDWWDGLLLNPDRGYVTHRITRDAADFIRRHRERRFCVLVAHQAVHFPWQGPKDGPQRGPGKSPPVEVDRERAFREMLVELDRGVGALRSLIEQLGIEEHTLVMFFSDNGPDGGSAGSLRGRKGSNWEGGHRVPAIAWWPGTIQAGRESDQLCITLDVMPTLLELAGLAPPQHRPLDGLSLSPLLLRGEPLGRRQLFWNNQAMRDGPWKLIRDGKAGPPLGLYHLEHDLGEATNLAAMHPQRVASMVRALEAWHADVSASQSQESE